MGVGPSPPGGIRSFHSPVGTDPGPTTSAVILPLKSISTSSSSLGVHQYIAFFHHGSSPGFGGLGFIHGARPGSPTGTHGLSLGLGLELLSAITNKTSTVSSVHIRSYASSCGQQPVPAPSHHVVQQLVSSENLSLYLTPTTNLLHTNTDKSSSDISHSPAMSSAFPRPSALSNRRADCASGGATESSGGHGGRTGSGGSDHGHEHKHERKTSRRKSTPSQGNRPRSEGRSGDGSLNVEPGPRTEEVRVYLILFL
jgi:hypothetical protein